MPGMYDQGLPSAATPPMGGMLPQGSADIGGQRDRITQALMDVQNPPPVTPISQQQGMPAASGAPPMAGAMPTAATPQQMGAIPGQMPTAGGLPGQMPLVGQGGAMPGMQAPLGQMGGGANTSGFGLGQIPQGTAGGDVPGMMQQRAPAGGPTY